MSVGEGACDVCPDHEQLTRTTCTTGWCMCVPTGPTAKFTVTLWPSSEDEANNPAVRPPSPLPTCDEGLRRPQVSRSLARVA